MKLKPCGDWPTDRSMEEEPLTLAVGVVVVVAAGWTMQHWLEVDLFGEGPLDEGRDLRPR